MLFCSQLCLRQWRKKTWTPPGPYWTTHRTWTSTGWTAQTSQRSTSLFSRTMSPSRNFYCPRAQERTSDVSSWLICAIGGAAVIAVVWRVKNTRVWCSGMNVYMLFFDECVCSFLTKFNMFFLEQVCSFLLNVDMFFFNERVCSFLMNVCMFFFGERYK